jgi:hypothetical protein
LATETKTNGQQIVITTAGLLEGIDTSALNEGDIIYLGTGGTITNVHASGIDAVQRIGHAVKINGSSGSMIVELSPLTVINDHNGTVRFQLVNQNTGTAASAAFTIVNDANHRASLSMVGSNFSALSGLTIQESLILYSEGYNKTINYVDGNYGFEWFTNTNDTHDLTGTVKMELSADGILTVGTVDALSVSAGTLVVTGTTHQQSQLYFDNKGETITASATTFDLSTGNIFINALSGATEMDYSNAEVGTYMWEFNGQTTSSVLTFAASKFQSPAGTTPVLTATAGAVDMITAYYNGSKMVIVPANNIIDLI